MDRTFIEKITELSSPNVAPINGYTYTDKTLEVVRLPRVATMNFRTLRGMVETLKHEISKFEAPLIVNVLSHAKVEIYSAIFDEDRTRELPYSAEPELPSIEFGRQTDYENMMITLKSKFAETPSLIDVVQLLGTITEENNATLSDDGFTQSAVVRKGIVTKENKAVKPIVRLKPYRTFLEIEQPESEFLLRLHDGMRVALYEADGGAWKLSARTNIANFLRTELAELISNKALIVVE